MRNDESVACSTNFLGQTYSNLKSLSIDLTLSSTQAHPNDKYDLTLRITIN